MALYNGRTLDQWKSDFEEAQREYNSMLQGGGGLASVNSIEHAKKKLDLATADYDQAQRAQNTKTTSQGNFITCETPVLNNFLASHKASNPLNSNGSSTNINPGKIINTSVPIFNPSLISNSKTSTYVMNQNTLKNPSANFGSDGLPANSANLGASLQDPFRGGYGSILNTDTYRKTIDPSFVNADTADLKSLKSAMTAAYSNYDTLRAGQGYSGAYGIHIAGQAAQTNADVEGAYQTYLTAEKAYNDALQTHNDAEMAKTINADVATLNQLESVKNNADFVNKSAQGKIENHRSFDNYAPSTGRLIRGQTVGAGGYDSIDYMTPDEQNVYAYLLSSDESKAKQYKDALSRSLNYRSMTDYQAMVKDQSQKSTLQGVLYNAFGNAEKPFALAGTAVQAVDDLVSGKSEPLDSNSGYFIGNQTADTSEKALIDKAKTPTGKWWTSQLLGVSNAVPIVAASLVNPELGLAIMSSEAAGDAAYSVAERGGTALQGTTSGLIIGCTQYLLGKMPVGKLSEIKNASSAITVKNVINDYGKQLLPVATMNAMSVLTDNLTDQMVMGNKSAINEYSRQLEAQGMSEQDALKTALTEFYGKHLLTALAGSALQAGVFTGGAEAFKGINKPKLINLASPDNIISVPPKESPHFSEADDSAYMSNTTMPQKSDEERLSEIYDEKTAEDLLKAYKEYLKTNPVDQKKETVYNEGTGDKIVNSYRRPSGFRRGVRDQVWTNALFCGEVKDPLTETIMNKNEPWDMGHKPGFEFIKHQQSALERGISRKLFLDEHNNPDHYRPELPSSNRSHAGEDMFNNYYRNQ